MSRSHAGSDLFPSNPAVAIPVTETSQLGEARRLVTALAAELGFGETERGRVAIVASELATNLVRHGEGGELVIRPLSTGGVNGVEILALDHGRGMKNIDQALSDGFSTGGTSGHGLGGIGRLTSVFDLYSAVSDATPVVRAHGGVGRRPCSGTAMVAQLWATPEPPAGEWPFTAGAVSLPYPGEFACGDAWALEQRGARVVVIVADGLGHGPEAAAASAEMLRVFREDPLRGPAAILKTGHEALRTTRGAAVAIADINLETGMVQFAGIGNISAAIFSGDERKGMISHNGTVGYEMRTPHEISYAWRDDSLLIMHSDGLQTSWRLDDYPGLEQAHPSVIAGVMYRDFTRGRDDVTVLVARDRAWP